MAGKVETSVDPSPSPDVSGYAYVRSNPIGYFDPDGREERSINNLAPSGRTPGGSTRASSGYPKFEPAAPRSFFDYFKGDTYRYTRVDPDSFVLQSDAKISFPRRFELALEKLKLTFERVLTVSLAPELLARTAGASLYRSAAAEATALRGGRDGLAEQQAGRQVEQRAVGQAGRQVEQQAAGQAGRLAERPSGQLAEPQIARTQGGASTPPQESLGPAAAPEQPLVGAQGLTRPRLYIDAGMASDRELQIASQLSKQGRGTVVIRDPIPGRRTSDLLIEGAPYDIYIRQPPRIPAASSVSSQRRTNKPPG